MAVVEIAFADRLDGDGHFVEHGDQRPLRPLHMDGAQEPDAALGIDDSFDGLNHGAHGAP